MEHSLNMKNNFINPSLTEINSHSQSEYNKKIHHKKSWEELARNIAKTSDQITDTVPNTKSINQGELIIIGSGIETLGFTMGDEELIKTADKVFYCVADPATAIWIRDLHPAAYDLYVLYNDNKVRYTTYMQMTEAQLYYVRQGERVVVIYYGHPGIFVLSTHRAIMIARREGHRAIMRPGISALDCLCADLGVDPCHPGMQTHEATDMLLRMRKPDISLHVVLWQVGLIGEMGFRRKGYINSNFSIFINYLQEFYGEDYQLNHYVASRYPTIPPKIEIYKLSNLHKPEIQSRITGLSTFYLAPKDSVVASEEMARSLGLINKDQQLRKISSPIREIGEYGSRERKAFSDFAKFKVPAGYHWQENTGVAKFLIQLRKDPILQQRYAQEPLKLLQEDQFNYLTQKEKNMIASRDTGAIQVSAKSLHKKSELNQNLLINIHKKRSTAVKLLNTINQKANAIKNGKVEISTLLQNEGFEVDWSNIEIDINYFNRDYLLAWTGVYIDVSQKFVLTILASIDNNKSIIYINNDRINRFNFTKGKLSWQKEFGNPLSGFLRLDIDTNTGKRNLIGKVWNDHIPFSNNFKAIEGDPARDYLSSLAYANELISLKDLKGDYNLILNRKKQQEIFNMCISDTEIILNDFKLQNVQYSKNKLTWYDSDGNIPSGQIYFIIDPLSLTLNLFGHIKLTEFTNEKNNCYGYALNKQHNRGIDISKVLIPEWAWKYLVDISTRVNPTSNLLIWHRWEQHNLSNKLINNILSSIIY